MRPLVAALTVLGAIASCQSYGESSGDTPGTSGGPGTSSTSSSSGDPVLDGGADAQADQGTPGIVGDASPDGPLGAPVLIGDWPFTEGSGNTINDVSGKGHNGTAAGGSWTSNRGGTAGNAYLFASNGDQITVPAHPDFDRPTGAKLTITAWARADGTPDHWYLLDVGFGSEGFGLEILNGTTVTYWDGDNHVANGPVSNVGSWHHYGVVVDGATARTYFDGVRVGEASASTTPRTATKIYFGKDAVEPVYMKGAIDQVRYYRGALTDAEMLADKNR